MFPEQMPSCCCRRRRDMGAVVLVRAAKAPIMPGTMMCIWEFKLLEAARYHGRSAFNLDDIILDSIPENKSLRASWVYWIEMNW